MRTSWHPDQAEPEPQSLPSADTATSSINRRSSFQVRSTARSNGPSNPSVSGEWQDPQGQQPEIRRQPNARSRHSGAPSRSPFSRPTRSSASRTHHEPGASSSRPQHENQTVGLGDNLRQSLDLLSFLREESISSKLETKPGTAIRRTGKETTPPGSDSETIQQLRREKEALEVRNARLEDDLKQSLAMLKPLGYGVASGRNTAAHGTGKNAGQPKESPLLLGGSPTPRGILFLKLLERQLEKEGPSNTHYLDNPLDPDQAAGFAGILDAHHHLLAPRSSWITVCALCKIPKFQGVPVASSVSDPALTLFIRPPSDCNDIFNEFHSSWNGITPCCSKPICDTCYVREICSSFQKDFWHNLESEYWVKCPSPPCRSKLTLRHYAEVESLLSSLYDPHLLDHTAQFKRANLLRAALRALDPAPSPDALVRASRLARRLQKRNLMYNPFTIEGSLDTAVKVMPVDSHTSETLQVPIFVNLLILRASGGPGSESGRECAVCAETLIDVTDGSPEDEARWMEAIDGFPGDWVWMVRSFPSPSSLRVCSRNHDLDICHSCLAQHLATQIESRGRAGSESLTCPSPGCGHVYSHEEVRILAKPETFAQYDKLRLLGHLATLPNFRWCLREGCDMGQVYDFPSMPNFVGTHQRSRVLCDACGFEMCFHHQIPWHEGQSCVDYDGDRGDPEIAATEEWLRENTKPCPGLCGASVEKKGGCFHMTCQVCRFEFCWECLADWSAIAHVDPVTNRRRYRRDAHNIGCYFRQENAPEATMVAGNTVGDALEGYL